MKNKTSKSAKEALESCTQEIIIDPHGDLFPDRIEETDEKTVSESYRRLQMIYDIGRNICSTTDLDNLLKKTIEALIRSIALERCFIAAFNEEYKLEPLINHNIKLSEDISEWPTSKTIITRALKDSISILSADALQDERFSHVQSIDYHNIRSVICVPLGPKGSSNGIIYADNRLTSRSFSQLDLHFVTALSHYIDLGIRNARELTEAKSRQQLSDERCEVLQQELLREHQVVGKSLKLLETYEDLRRIAVKEVPILLLGKTGTGKELFAKAAHKLSKRSDKVFMPLNIAELSETIIESELFGHEGGAFTGALKRKIGRLELTNEGTLFLDEVAEIPLHIQAKLLRVLETGEFMRAGGTQLCHTDVRLVCATNSDLENLVAQGQFREDLYYRLKGATIKIPPLRERTGDIPELVNHALKKIGSDKAFSPSAIRRMQKYSWPGNVRQLIHMVQELDAVHESQTIQAKKLPEYIGTSTRYKESDFPPLKDVLAQIEEKHFRQALDFSKGDNNRAIKLLGISRATYFERKKRYNL